MGKVLSYFTFPVQILSLSALGFVMCTYILLADPTVYENPTKKTKVIDSLEPFTIYYTKGSVTLTKTDLSRLQKFADYLVSDPTKEVRIESHSFLEGNENKELLLSEKRSLEVERFFLIHGVQESQIRRFFYGGSRPDKSAEQLLNRNTKVSLNR